MHWLAAPSYALARLVLQRGLGAVYLVGFLVAYDQFPALCGARGLLPAPRLLRVARFWDAPSLFHLGYSDRALRAVAATGVVLSALVALGAVAAAPLWAGIAVFLALWALYLSIVSIGGTFYAFGWESLLLEAGFLGIFLGPARVAPPAPLVFLYRWLLFRLEFGAGLIKLRGDPCWRDLTCLYYHHETQPLPNPASWWFHHLPKPLHRVEALVNHFAQLVVPFGLFCPQPVADAAGAVVVVTQGWLLLSGNFAWLNALTLVLAFSAFDDAALGRVLHPHLPAAGPQPLGYAALVLALTLLVLVLSYRPARNLFSRRQLMNASFDPLRLVNTYGAFGAITRERDEIVIEGTLDPAPSHATEWRPYEFKGKPGDVRRRPPQVAPYHLRLDWLMWFAAMGPPWHHPWFLPLLERLLRADPPTLRLLGRDPFDGERPAFVRARLYRYRYTSWQERRQTGAFWKRELRSEYVPPLARDSLWDRPLEAG